MYTVGQLQILYCGFESDVLFIEAEDECSSDRRGDTECIPTMVGAQNPRLHVSTGQGRQMRPPAGHRSVALEGRSQQTSVSDDSDGNKTSGKDTTGTGSVEGTCRKFLRKEEA